MHSQACQRFVLHVSGEAPIFPCNVAVYQTHYAKVQLCL